MNYSTASTLPATKPTQRTPSWSYGSNVRPPCTETRFPHVVKKGILRRLPPFIRKRTSSTSKTSRTALAVIILLSLITAAACFVAVMVVTEGLSRFGCSRHHRQSVNNDEFHTTEPKSILNALIDITSATPPTATASAEEGGRICTSAQCVQLAAALLGNMNTSTDICQDPWNFMCGSRKSWGPTSLREMADQRLRATLKALLEDRHSATADMQTMFTYYDACINETSKEATDLLPLTALLADFGGWPLIQNAKFDSRYFKWETVEAQLQLMGIDGLLRLSATAGDRNETVVWEVHKPTTLSEQLHANDQHEKASLRSYLLDLLESLGADQSVLEDHVDDMLELDNRMGKVLVQAASDMMRSEPVTRSQMKENFPKIAWDELLNQELKTGFSFSSTADDLCILSPADYVHGLEEIVGETELEVLHNYLMTKLVVNMDKYLPRKYRHASELFHLSIRRSTAFLDCIAETAEGFPETLERLHMRHISTDALGPKILRDLAKDILVSVPSLNQHDITIKVGGACLKSALGTEEDEQEASSDAEEPSYTSFFDMHLKLRRHQAQKRQQYSSVVDVMSTSNPLFGRPYFIHNGPSTTLVLPSSMMEYPVYDDALPLGIACGSLGPMIARSILERIRNETVPMTEKQKPDADSDLGQLEIAYKAFKYRKARETKKDRARLPALDRYDGDQIFFLAYGSTECTTRESDDVFRLLPDFMNSFRCR